MWQAHMLHLQGAAPGASWSIASSRSGSRYGRCQGCPSRAARGGGVFVPNCHLQELARGGIIGCSREVLLRGLAPGAVLVAVTDFFLKWLEVSSAAFQHNRRRKANRFQHHPIHLSESRRLSIIIETCGRESRYASLTDGNWKAFQTRIP